MPVAPVIAPPPVIEIDGEVMKLSKPVPNVNPLNVLLACVVTLPKLTPVIVFVPEPFPVPVRLIPSPLSVVVPDDALSVALIVVPAPELLL